ncbi:hypothetical protein [Rhizobium giardinii]|uniref:Uncharacterized protein n=1 Tax=Rhizobium giardinii TaxID=56731 RepID=A0A7W8XB28_9HYPH|nr:hypothetical protein [Rhizobium giardinii]MBB5538307.1 hypothetical protein [Rhizobium giardinii]
MAELLDLNHVRLTNRPLIVCDIDEVVLEFLTPFRDFLRSRGHDLLPRSFRLHGNIVHLDSGEALAEDLVSALQEEFFLRQAEWQMPAELAVETLAELAGEADIVFLTAMPPRHATVRRALLDRFRLNYPLLASEEAKGPIVKRLQAGRGVPFAFIDDIWRNLHSVREHAPDCLLVNLMVNADFRALAPDPGEGISKAGDWADVARIVRAHISR